MRTRAIAIECLYGDIVQRCEKFQGVLFIHFRSRRYLMVTPSGHVEAFDPR